MSDPFPRAVQAAADTEPVFPSAPRINRVAIDSPWHWLADGWRDLLYAPHVSLGYGAGLAAVSFGLTVTLGQIGLIYLVLPMTAGFFLVAPILAVGLYEVSRRRDRGAPVEFADMAPAFRRNGAQLALMGLILMLIHLVWIRVAMLLFALFFTSATPTFDRMVAALLFSPVSIPFLVLGSLIGAAFAALTFAIAVVSIPMLLDRDVTVFTAIATSWTAARVNWRPLALWAALIVVFTTLGLATLYIGLIVTAPLIAHASWRAYRALVV